MPHSSGSDLHGMINLSVFKQRFWSECSPNLGRCHRAYRARRTRLSFPKIAPPDRIAGRIPARPAAEHYYIVIVRSHYTFPPFFPPRSAKRIITRTCIVTIHLEVQKVVRKYDTLAECRVQLSLLFLLFYAKKSGNSLKLSWAAPSVELTLKEIQNVYSLAVMPKKNRNLPHLPLAGSRDRCIALEPVVRAMHYDECTRAGRASSSGASDKSILYTGSGGGREMKGGNPLPLPEVHRALPAARIIFLPQLPVPPQTHHRNSLAPPVIIPTESLRTWEIWPHRPWTTRDVHDVIDGSDIGIAAQALHVAHHLLFYSDGRFRSDINNDGMFLPDRGHSALSNRQ